MEFSTQSTDRRAGPGVYEAVRSEPRSAKRDWKSALLPSAVTCDATITEASSSLPPLPIPSSPSTVPGKADTMAEEEAPLHSSVPTSEGLITTPQPHDVLLGRGTRPNGYIGNKRFRSLVKDRKEEYTSTVRNKEKQMIAMEVLSHIYSLGGRFLRSSEENVDATMREGSLIVEGAVRCVAPYDAALEKCKQALREKRSKRAALKKRTAKEEREAEVAEKKDVETKNPSNMSHYRETESTFAGWNQLCE